MDVKTRLGWVRLYEQPGDAGVVCERCGMADAAEAVASVSDGWRCWTEGREPPSAPSGEAEGVRRLGIKQLRSELLRQHGLSLSLDALHRILVRHGEQHPNVCKIVPAVYQYTAIDDCSRYRVLGVYPRRIAANTLDFSPMYVGGSMGGPQRRSDERAETGARRTSGTPQKGSVRGGPTQPP